MINILVNSFVISSVLNNVFFGPRVLLCHSFCFSHSSQLSITFINYFCKLLNPKSHSLYLAIISCYYDLVGMGGMCLNFLDFWFPLQVVTSLCICQYLRGDSLKIYILELLLQCSTLTYNLYTCVSSKEIPALEFHPYLRPAF